VTDLDRPAPPPIPPAQRAAGRARRWVLRGLVPFLVVSWLLGMWLYINHRDPELFGDKTFIAAAGAVCAQSQARIDERQPPGGDASAEERASSVERVSTILADMARSLRALPVRSVDAAAADRWLDELDAFVAIGPRYAAAIRSGDEHRAEDLGNEGNSPNHRFNATARANGIDHCVLG
jgi:hypothetical protein